MTYKIELREKVVRAGRPFLVSTETTTPPPTEYPFRSVYMFPPDGADLIEAQGNMQNLEGMAVASSLFPIDVDEESNVQPVIDILESLKVDFWVFDTGNRGVHIHIPLHEILESPHLPYSMRHWLDQNGLSSLVDTTFYHPAGQFRRQGAIHHKTGKPKQFRYRHAGYRLRLPIVEAPKEVYEPVEVVTPEDSFCYQENLKANRGPGKRHLHMYILWKEGRRIGLPREQICRDILEWNNRQDEPHPESLVLKKLKGFR